MNTHDLVCDFGKHKGVLYTKLPVSYLKWIVNCNLNKSRSKIAQSELKRRKSL